MSTACTSLSHTPSKQRFTGYYQYRNQYHHWLIPVIINLKTNTLHFTQHSHSPICGCNPQFIKRGSRLYSLVSLYKYEWNQFTRKTYRELRWVLFKSAVAELDCKHSRYMADLGLTQVQFWHLMGMKMIYILSEKIMMNLSMYKYSIILWLFFCRFLKLIARMP